MTVSLLLAFLGVATFALTALAMARPRRQIVAEASAFLAIHHHVAPRRNRLQRRSIPASRAAA